MTLCKFRTFVIAVVALAAAHSIASAQPWTGLGTDNLWTNTANWDTNSVPVSTNTATFNDLGNANTNISLGGASQPIGSVVFDTANVATYNLGVLASGDTLNFDSGGAITVNTAVTNAQTINAAVNTNGPLNVTVSNATTAGLTLAGVISGAGPLTITNIGAVNLNAQNTYIGGTSFPTTTAQGFLRIGADTVGTPGSVTSGPFGTGTITTSSSLPQIFQPIGADRTIANAWDWNPGGIFVSNNTTLDPTPRSLTLTGNINVTGSRTITNNLVAGATLTLGSAANPGTITRNNTITWQTQSGTSGVGGGVLVINDAISGSNSLMNFQNGLKVTLNNTISGTGALTVSAANTVAHFNKTGMYSGTGALTVQTGATGYFDQPNVLAATNAVTVQTGGIAHFNQPNTIAGTFTTNGAASTSYIDSALTATGTFNIENDAVVYVNAPTTYSGTAGSAMNIQLANTLKQTALVVNSTLTRSGAATSAVRIATGTLAGNNGTIFAPVNVLNSTNGPSYLAPGSPAVSGGTNTTPAYQNGPGKLTIDFATGNALDFNGTGTPTCTGCNLYSEIGGTTPGTQYDQVVVNGTAAIGTSTAQRAHLTVALINSYPIQPAADADFELIRATTLSAGMGFLDAVLPGANWSVLYGSVAAPNSLVVHVTGTGDFNGDHIVDAADYVMWRKIDGTPGGYDAFRRNFGNTVPGSGSSGLGITAIPEPGTMVLLVVGSMAMACPRRVLHTRNS